MADSEIVRAIKRQRQEVMDRELSALRRLTRLWVPSFDYLKQQVKDLTELIDEKRKNGEEVEIEYFYSLDRYKRMKEGARQRIWKYDQAAAGIISGEESEVTDLGHKNGEELVNIAEPDDPMWTRVNTKETRIMAGMTAKGSPLEDLLRKSYDETFDAIERDLMIGISTGQGSAWIADRLAEAGNIPLERATLIARTEVNRAYRQANWETMRSSRAVIGYRRMCYPPTACFACLALDGEFSPGSIEPCDHPNGKCSFVPVTKHFDPGKEKGWEKGLTWLEQQDEETQIKIMGRGHFELWKQGMDPRDMVTIKENPIWGGNPSVIPLYELRGLH